MLSALVMIYSSTLSEAELNEGVLNERSNAYNSIKHVHMIILKYVLRECSKKIWEYILNSIMVSLTSNCICKR